MSPPNLPQPPNCPRAAHALAPAPILLGLPLVLQLLQLTVACAALVSTPVHVRFTLCCDQNPGVHGPPARHGVDDAQKPTHAPLLARPVIRAKVQSAYLAPLK